MIKNTRQLSRRSVLHGAGAMLALPFLEALPLRALADTAGAAAKAGPPLRMGIFTVTGGTVLESFTPKEVGTLKKLPSILRPLEFAKDQLTVISGLSHAGRSDNLNGHEHCALLHLTGAPSVKKEGGKLFAEVSVDQAAAQHVGDNTFLPSLELGLNNNQYSFRGPGNVVPYEANPRLVFDRMFRGRKPVVPNWARRGSAPAESAQQSARTDSDDQSVIDLVMGQAKELRTGLGKTDQRKIDEYLESVRSVEKRIAFVEARHRQEVLDLASPGPSKLAMPENLPANNDWFWKQRNPIEHDPTNHGQYISLMADLMILAFQTDTTRVATFAAGSDESMFPGVVTVGYERHCHTLEHQGNAGRVEDADPISREACRQIHMWYTQLFGEMVRKMQNIDEGGSSLLDNTMLLYTSYMADGGHGKNEYPVVLVGNAGNTIKPGRHLRFEKQAPVSNLYVEMLNRMGRKTETFGDSATSTYAGSYNSRIPGLV